MTDARDRGREAFGRQAWGDAYTLLAAADGETPLEVDDLERFAIAAYLIGKDDDTAEITARAHHECLRIGDTARAARCAFWLAFGLMMRDEMAPAGGWLARAARLLDDAGLDCVEQGYLLVPDAIGNLFGGDPATASAIFDQAGKIGARFRDPDLTALAGFGGGQALIRMGRTREGMAMLDEVMVAVTAAEVSPIIAGLVYCGVIEACQETLDIRRAQEWTAALSHWCESQPDLVHYRGQCLVHRAEIMQWHGAWPDAMDEVQRARDRLSHPPGQPAIGAACYQEAELHRLRGDFAAAEAAYRQASQCGRDPQPGLARLRLAQGQVETAAAAIRRVLDEAKDPVTRSKMLVAYVEIVLAADDVAAARGAADELAAIAADLDAPFLNAMSAHATGAVLLAEANARAALDALRRARTAWHELDAPYEAARARMLIGLAYRALGDEDGAEMELDAARSTFEQLGAVPDHDRVEALCRKAAAVAPGGLTVREMQVLRLIATGKTNRAIAADLFLSDKTVARHVSNIFTKLDLSSRSAATAYAYEHDLA